MAIGKTKKNLLLGGLVAMLTLGLIVFLSLYRVSYPGMDKPIQTVTFRNDTDRLLVIGYMQSQDNTWHTAASRDEKLEPDSTIEIQYRSGDWVFVEDVKQILDAQTSFVITTDTVSAELILKGQP